MLKISTKICSKLYTTKYLSNLVTYIYIKTLFSGKIREEDLYVVAKERGLSIGVIKNHIEQLIKLGFLEKRNIGLKKGKQWFFIIGNQRYNDINDLQGRDAIIFDETFDNRLGYKDDSLLLDKLLAFKNLKKLRTYIHVSLQKVVVLKYLKPTLTEKQALEREAKNEKKKLNRKLKRLAKNKKKFGIKTNEVKQQNPKIELISEPNLKTESSMSDSLQFSISSSYINNALGTHQKGFSASTIRKQQNKAVKLGLINKTRCFNIIASTKEFKDYHIENYTKHNFDFTDTNVTNSDDILKLYQIGERTNNLYSPLFLWTNNPTKVKGNKLKDVKVRPGDILGKLGQINALVQEVSPTVSFHIPIGKFSKIKIKVNSEFKEKFIKPKYTQSYRPKLVYEDVVPNWSKCNLDILELI